MDKERMLLRVGSYMPLLDNALTRQISPLPPLIGYIWDDQCENHKTELVLEKGASWGGGRKQFKVQGEVNIPDTEHPVYINLGLGRSESLAALSFLYGPEGLVELDGSAVFGFDPHHNIQKIPEQYCDGSIHSISITGWTGIEDCKYSVEEMSLCSLNKAALELRQLCRAVLEIHESSRGSSGQSLLLLEAVYDALNRIDFSDTSNEGFDHSAESVLARLIQRLEALGSAGVEEITACGHGHLDIAWLWTVSQARRKAAQTFLNSLHLMEQYEGYYFSQTQAQLYEFIRQDQPRAFSEVKKRVQQGRWELLGRSWVEFDANLSGGESLVRQFLLGDRYFNEHFGTSGSPVVWLPDTFGFCGQLPQLMKSAGVEYFATAKLTWNGYNKMPHTSFIWRGIDGSEILSHIVSTSQPGWWGATYSADLTASELLSSVSDTGETKLLVAYGRGDGGGGPSFEMIHRAGLMDGFPGLPVVRQGRFIDFFNELEHRRDRLPIWKGELYLELHRGTYTSQAETKKANRLCEKMLHDCEFFAAWASWELDAEYPGQELKSCWELLCLNQFHDILPGSSIAEVYTEASEQYKEIYSTAEAIINLSLKKLSALCHREADYAIFNSVQSPVGAVLELPEGIADECYIADMTGRALPSCTQNGKTLVQLEALPSYGFICLQILKGEHSEPERSVWVRVNDGGACLENNLICAVINKKGEIVSLYDKELHRELVPDGLACNKWQLFEDRPADWEAWDIDEFYADKPLEAPELMRIAVELDTPLCCALSLSWEMDKSRITQRISLSADRKRIDFNNNISWYQRRALLKVAFPLNISSDTAVCDIQWGSIERPATRNTLWDRAQFEICAHKWVDLSEGDYGVSLINDCKYGHDVTEGCIRLTALKGSCFPDEHADEGEHSFSYALLPHKGSWREETAMQAYRFGNPPRIVRLEPSERKNGQAQRSFVRVRGNAVLETIKIAEDSEKELILRLYEDKCTRGAVSVGLDGGLDSAYLCSILEKPLERLEADGNIIKYSSRPYGINSLRIRRKG